MYRRKRRNTLRAYLIPNREAFHGTPRDFAISEARPAWGVYGPGFYLSTYAEEAVHYARMRREQHGGRAAVYECDVELTDPLDYADIEAVVDHRAPDDARVDRDIVEIVEDEGDTLEADEAIAMLRALGGWDGIVVHLAPKGDGPEWRRAGREFFIVFDPTQLRCVRRLI